MLDRTNLNTPGAKIKPDMEQLFDVVDGLIAQPGGEDTLVVLDEEQSIEVNQCEATNIFTNLGYGGGNECYLPPAEAGSVFRAINLDGHWLSFALNGTTIRYNGRMLANGYSFTLPDYGCNVKLYGNADGSWNVIEQYGCKPFEARILDAGFSGNLPTVEVQMPYIQVYPVSAFIDAGSASPGVTTNVLVDLTNNEYREQYLVGFFTSIADDMDIKRMRRGVSGQLKDAAQFPIGDYHESAKLSLLYRGVKLPPDCSPNGLVQDLSGRNLLVVNHSIYSSYRFWSPISNTANTKERINGVLDGYPASAEGYFNYNRLDPLVGFSDDGGVISGWLGSNVIPTKKLTLVSASIQDNDGQARLSMLMKNYETDGYNFDFKIAVYG